MVGEPQDEAREEQQPERGQEHGLRTYTVFALQNGTLALCFAPKGEEFAMSNLVTRVQNILMTPKTEWPVIAAEPETTSGLYTRYILILSALGPLAMFLKSTLIGTSDRSSARSAWTWARASRHSC